MRSTNLKILAYLLAADILLALISMIFFDIKVFYNTQVGFLSATLIMFASMASYRRMVAARVKHEIITVDDSKDTIDKIEDPYDLYSEDVVENEEDEHTLSEVVKEEKRKLKASKRSLFQTLKDTKAALSFYRLGAYAVLILGFMYLNRHGILHIPALILGISLPIVIVVATLLATKANQTQDTVQ